MIWLLLLHISTISLWCALLLYLPVLIRADSGPGGEASLNVSPRLMFSHVATPLAVLAIFTGTLLFLLQGNISGWLLAKLMAVCALVVCHVLCGWLVLTIERNPGVRCGGRAMALVVFAATAMLTIVWLVLARPL